MRDFAVEDESAGGAASDLETFGNEVFELHWRSFLGNEEQSYRVPGEAFRRTMKAGRYGAARVVNRDAPEMPDAEAERLRGGEGRVVKVVAVLAEIVGEALVVRAAVLGEQNLPHPREGKASDALVIAEPFTGGAVIGA